MIVMRIAARTIASITGNPSLGRGASQPNPRRHTTPADDQQDDRSLEQDADAQRSQNNRTKPSPRASRAPAQPEASQPWAARGTARTRPRRSWPCAPPPRAARCRRDGARNPQPAPRTGWCRPEGQQHGEREHDQGRQPVCRIAACPGPPASVTAADASSRCRPVWRASSWKRISTEIPGSPASGASPARSRHRRGGRAEAAGKKARASPFAAKQSDWPAVSVITALTNSATRFRLRNRIGLLALIARP